ncbi:MAG: caspase family protein [Acidobacteria bacterium]|nr:caspase family protein [Acidobacteriota bacterium]
MRPLLPILCLALAAAGQERDLGYEKAQKIAFVVGNSAYPKWPLRNPANDARSVAQSLTELGFRTETAIDLSLPNLDRAISKFVGQVKAGDVAMFYYAGHGIQIEGENYLVPVDFNAKDETDAKYAAYSASRVQERLEKAGARVILVVLDACRNNPFQSTRSAGGGLAAMGSGKGTLIAFATAPGKTADDNPNGSNGLFTSHLITALREPGLSLDQVFNRVRERVYTDSKGRQVPWTVSSVIGDVYLRPGAAATMSPPAPANPLARISSTPVAERIAPVQRTADLSGGTAALERGDFQTAIQQAQDVLRGDPQNKDALHLLTSGYYRTQQWNLFVPTAKQALRAGDTLQFLLGHHHTLTGIHAAVLTVTREKVEFKSLQGQCNQPPVSVPLKSLQNAQAVTSQQGEIFLNVKLLDEKSKQRNFNFADADSTVSQNSSGLPQVISPPKAAQLLQSIAAVLIGAQLPQ